MGRPKQHDAATRAVLLAAAERLLATGGQDALTVRRVSEAAGTSTRAVYSLFGGKDGLRSALKAEAAEGLWRLIGAVPEGPDPVFDLVRTGIAGFRELALARPHLFRLACDWPERALPAVADYGATGAVRALLAARVRRAAGPMTTKAEVARLAAGFQALCLGLALTEAAGHDGEEGADPLELWQEGLATYVLGFALPSPP